jgi:hypothetical protein
MCTLRGVDNLDHQGTWPSRDYLQPPCSHMQPQKDAPDTIEFFHQSVPATGKQGQDEARDQKIIIGTLQHRRQGAGRGTVRTRKVTRVRGGGGERNIGKQCFRPSDPLGSLEFQMFAGLATSYLSFSLWLYDRGGRNGRKKCGA